MHGRDLLAAVLARVVERVLNDALGARHGDRLDRDPGVLLDVVARGRVELDDLVDERGCLGRVLLELDARVEVLGVLTDEDDVDIVVVRAHALV